MQYPFEGSPRRMKLEAVYNASVMRVFDVGVATSDMRDDAALFTAQSFEQLVRRVDRIGGSLALDQDVGGAAYRASFVAKQHIAVTAHAGVARPFIAGQTDELARLIKLGGKLVELFPKPIGNLEIVALVADHIDEGLVTGVAKIFLRRTHPDGLSTLAVQIGPIATHRRGSYNAKGIGCRDKLAIFRYCQVDISSIGSDKIFNYQRTITFCDRDAVRQAT